MTLAWGLYLVGFSLLVHFRRSDDAGSLCLVSELIWNGVTVAVLEFGGHVLHLEQHHGFSDSQLIGIESSGSVQLRTDQPVVIFIHLEEILTFRCHFQRRNTFSLLVNWVACDCTVLSLLLFSSLYIHVLHGVDLMTTPTLSAAGQSCYTFHSTRTDTNERNLDLTAFNCLRVKPRIRDFLSFKSLS